MDCNVTIENNDYDLIVSGEIKDTVKNNTIYYIAANGPDRRASFTGSGLPFANQIQAFENTPNMGKVELIDNKFEIKLVTPNSYMIGLGSVTVPPTLFISYFNQEGIKKSLDIKVAEPIPYRSLTYPVNPRARKDATFYDSQFHLVPKTQEQILYDSSYPCDGRMYDNFWGMRHLN